ncbi:MAG: hypothetical protein OMM_13181 [Candidatus Magnetoglobus multicellularis str. Araruama]|uniref:Uncharacterized protein n=1 Tax=Candidatus Magnetoglobus multicellularis str. Araruama TaxID=890399 RepID=A0A1V1NU83_9BACT|nr:MAG: hypothetical protein OMM_13181 [Candidatus Magnetoglobus multicellularis str. Araruama]
MNITEIKRLIRELRNMSVNELVNSINAGGLNSGGLNSLLAINILARNGYLPNGSFVGVVPATNAMPKGYIKDFNKYCKSNQ